MVFPLCWAPGRSSSSGYRCGSMRASSRLGISCNFNCEVRSRTIFITVCVLCKQIRMLDGAQTTVALMTKDICFLVYLMNFETKVVVHHQMGK